MAHDMGRKRRRCRRNRNRKDRSPKPVENGLPEGYGEWWDENFAFIADFTEGGAPYGITWEEVDENGNLKEGPRRIAEIGEPDDDDRPPF